MANRFSANQVLYLGLRAAEIFDWYHDPKYQNQEHDSSEPSEEMVLIAADGVHPNARCYELWAQSLAEKLLDATSTD